MSVLWIWISGLVFAVIHSWMASLGMKGYFHAAASVG